MARFAQVSSNAAFPEGEKEILEFWRANRVFEKSLELRSDGKPFVFYEGPPTANGRPGIHHVLGRTFKDVFARYKTMQGFLVERKAGWDTHGLPVELEVEKELKISGKKQIEEFGVAKFNELCKQSVHRYIEAFELQTERMGYWLDMEHPYITYHGEYIESVWWSLKQLWDKGLMYQGYKVVPYCPRCQTSLSSHELSLGYKENTEDPSVFIKFQLSDEEHAYFLAWTTTPWTLPGNVALAVHPDETYVRVRQSGFEVILAKARLSVLDGDFEVVKELLGKQLVGMSYKPLFTELMPEGKAFVVISAPKLVSMDDGTGIVHTAAAYGEDDLLLCQQEGVAIRHVVGLDGKFLEGTRYAGMFVKAADPKIIEDLTAAGNMYRAERIKHTYPFCWRCDSPLLYYALTSWFIKTTNYKSQLIENNRKVNWQPENLREGRMGNWLENGIDWNLSRSRYWGTPLPIWECEVCKQHTCVGSTAELGLTVADDLHRPGIDQVTLKCEKCGGLAKRVPEVIDCWYDSGAMPFAQLHYPFENQEKFKVSFPADFICEGMDQTRGWFYTLLAEATLLFDNLAYRNVISTGIMLDEKGKKMSKSVGNVIDPIQVFDSIGADATRWYLVSATAAGNEYRVGPNTVQEVVRRFLLTLWNTYSFLITYAELAEFDPLAEVMPLDQRSVLDRWALARLYQTVEVANKSMDAYDGFATTRAIEDLVEDISKWFIRRSRRRFSSKNDDDADRKAAFATLYTVVLTVTGLIAPFIPFVAERMYRNLVGLDQGLPSGSVPESIHLTDYPKPEPTWKNTDVLDEMEKLRVMVELGLAKRDEAKIKVKQPLASATVMGTEFSGELEAIFADELNVKTVKYQKGDERGVILDTNITPELKREGMIRELSRKVNDLRKQAELQLNDMIILHVDANGELGKAIEEHQDHLLSEVLASYISKGRAEVSVSWEGQLSGEACWLGISNE